MPLDLTRIRAQFPALKQNRIFLDNPAGTQVAQPVLDRINRYLIETNANQGGAFQTSQDTDALLTEARAACADFYNAASQDEIVFGPNMTSMTLSLARSLGRTLQAGDSLVVTRLDHDANITPWAQIAAERQAHLHWVDFDVEDGTLNLSSLEGALASGPKLVAVGYASNALGTINPVRQITRMAKDAGALVFIDAVQYAPHGPIDVQDLGCDVLVSSAYKFFSTHVGVMYGRYALLEELQAYKVRPAPKRSPGKWETGTPNFEGIAGVLGVIEYLQWFGAQFGERQGQGRRERLVAAMQAIQAYELDLSRHLLDALEAVPGLRIYGITDRSRLAERVPTFSFTLEGWTPRQVAEQLGSEGIQVWDGNYYAIAVTERLGLEDSGGMVRVGPVHYNSPSEVDRLRAELDRLSAAGPR